MTPIDRIRTIRERIDRSSDVALAADVIWLCSYAIDTTASVADISRGYCEINIQAIKEFATERAVLRDVKEFAKEKIAALEKERDELRERLEQYESEQLARVCPGCHAVASERCAPGCIDAEMAQEREDALMFSGREEEEDDDNNEEVW